MIEWIKNLRSTEKGKTLFKFILYMIFFLFVLCLVMITNAVKPPRKYYNNSSESRFVESVEEPLKELSYFEKQKKLYSGHYDFTYRIKGEYFAEYNGEFNDGKVVGYRETEDDLIKYSIEDGKVYLNEFTGKKEYDELYLNFEPTFFDLDGIFQKLNSASSKIEKNTDEKRYNYENLDGYTFVVTTDRLSIISIEIYNDTIKYEFVFDYR